MAEITRKRSGELVRGVFQILAGEPEGLPVKDVLRRLEELVPPTPFEASCYPSSPQDRRYEKIVRFSTIAAVKAGWLVKSKGVWFLTDAGREALTKLDDPERLMREADRLYRQWAADQPVETTDATGVDEEQAVATLEEAEEAAWSEIEAFLARMSPYDLQQLVAGLLRGMGYFVEWVAPPGPDGGIDVIAHVDPLGVNGPRIKAQVKRCAERITVTGVRGFMALLGDSDVGIFVSTGGFTRDAEQEARRQEKRRIMLLDANRLFDLWVEHYARIPEDKRGLLPLRPVH